MVFDGIGPRSGRTEGGSLRLAIEPLDREQLLSRLELGRIVKGRILREFEPGSYLLRLVGYNLVAESERRLPVGGTLRFRVRSLEPRVDLQLLDEIPEGEASGADKNEAALNAILRGIGRRADETGRHILRRMMAHGLPPSSEDLKELRQIYLNTPPNEWERELEVRLFLRARDLPETEGNLEWARQAYSSPSLSRRIESLLPLLNKENPLHQKLISALKAFQFEPYSERFGGEAATERLMRFLESDPSRLELLIKKELPNAESKGDALRSKADQMAQKIEVLNKTAPLSPRSTALLNEIQSLLFQAGSGEDLDEELLLKNLRLLLTAFSEKNEALNLRKDLLDLIKSISSGGSRITEQDKEGFSPSMLARLLNETPEEFERAPAEAKRLLLRPLLLTVLREGGEAPHLVPARSLLNELEAYSLARNSQQPLSRGAESWLNLQIPLLMEGERRDLQIAIRRRGDGEGNKREREAGKRRQIDPRDTTLAFQLSTTRMGRVKLIASIEGENIFVDVKTVDEDVRKHLAGGEKEFREAVEKKTGLQLSGLRVAVEETRAAEIEGEDGLLVELAKESSPKSPPPAGLDVVV